MAEIHVMPVGFDPGRSQAAIRLLGLSVSAGQDLGDRQNHIRALGTALEKSRRELANVVQVLRETPGTDDDELRKILKVLDGLSPAIGHLAKTAQAYRLPE